MKILGYILFSFASFLLGACIYFVGGVIVAFSILALNPEKVESTYAYDAAEKLADFLRGAGGDSQTFTIAELNAGAMSIMNKGAAEESKKRNASVSVPIAPIFDIFNGKLCIILPVSVDLIFGRAETDISIFLSFHGGVSVTDAKIGSAKLPHFIADRLATSVLKPYGETEFLKPYVSEIESIERAEIYSNSIRLFK